MMDIFQVQSEIATQIALNLDITLLESDRHSIETMPTESPEAYQIFLRGLEYFKRIDASEEDNLMAINLFERAISLDTTFALAYVNLSESHWRLYHFYHYPEENLSKSRDAAQKALELRPDLPESHLAMGLYHYGLKEYDKALEEMEIASQISPNNIAVLKGIAYVQRRRGNFETAVENLEKALELDPQDMELIGAIGEIYIPLRDYQKANAYFDRVISLAPDHIGSYDYKAWNYVYWKGDLEKARETLKQMPVKANWSLAHIDLLDRNFQLALDRYTSIQATAFDNQIMYFPTALAIATIYEHMGQLELSHAFYDSAQSLLEAKLKNQPDDNRIYSSLGIAYAGLDLKEEAIHAGEYAIQLMPVSQDAMIGPLRVVDMAYIYANVGEYDDAIDLLEYLLSIPCEVSVSLLRLDPKWDPLRDHPRFQKLIAEQE
jgi:serine/threonine-protein kinase